MHKGILFLALMMAGVSIYFVSKKVVKDPGIFSVLNVNDTKEVLVLDGAVEKNDLDAQYQDRLTKESLDKQNKIIDNETDWENHLEELPVKEQKIAKAILRFREKIDHISKEDLQKEQKELKNALAKAKTIKIAPPVLEDYVDENGYRWVKKTYEGGIVRYDFPEALQ